MSEELTPSKIFEFLRRFSTSQFEDYKRFFKLNPGTNRTLTKMKTEN